MLSQQKGNENFPPRASRKEHGPADTLIVAQVIVWQCECVATWHEQEACVTRNHDAFQKKDLGFSRGREWVTGLFFSLALVYTSVNGSTTQSVLILLDFGEDEVRISEPSENSKYSPKL